MAAFNKSGINELTIKHILGTLSASEKAELDAFLDGAPDRRRRFEERVKHANMQHSLQAFMEAEKHRKRRVSRRGQRTRRRRLAPYALVVVLLAAAGVYWMQTKQVTPQASVANNGQDVFPGTSKAILTLADGTRIDLDAAQQGNLSLQGQAQVRKADSASVVYNHNGGSVAAREPTYNMVATPRGGTYLVVLADGSKAWLNAASSIRFPTSFAAGRRDVEANGEVYFDIKPNAAAPFYVHTAGTEVQVLGTEFNVRAYGNEPDENITLVAGAVVVSQAKDGGGNAAAKLKLAPGQQASITPGHSAELVHNADIEQAIAWRTGFFKFKNADIRSVMREIERWYDISISYQITDFSSRYGGRISRNLKLSELLHLLEGNHIYHYKMEGQKLIILP